MDLDSDDTWSDTSEEDESQPNPPFVSRAYQIEMFNHNGHWEWENTNVGADLLPSRYQTHEHLPLRILIFGLVWFTAPSVVLAYQQYRFLSQQLPAFQFRLITGADTPEKWTSKQIWDQVLHNIQVVVSTPAVLFNALNQGFVSSLAAISLLVFDEAHHGIKNSQQNEIMRVHYHPHNKPGSGVELPHILGLSASPITRNRMQEKDVLERNLNAVCRSPLHQLDEYTAFLTMPELIRLTYGTAEQRPSEYYLALQSVVSAIRLDDDPIVKTLRSRSDDLEAQTKLEKILRRNGTPAIKELQKFQRSSTGIQETLGNWACDMFIKNCIGKVEMKELHTIDRPISNSSPSQNHRFIKSCLRPLHEQILSGSLTMSTEDNISPKVRVLLDFLQKKHCADLRCLVFVKERHAAWCLTEILNNHPLTKGSYEAFSFVGLSDPSYKGTFDFTNLNRQLDNLERFRRGQLNICVATAVLEEGVDVPAMNLVICFDERPTFRSFVQSRGRARQSNSRFVILQDNAVKVQKWQALEKEMEQECQSTLREFEERQRIESMDESESEIFRVASTGATLTYSGARQLLSRFCAKLPRIDECEQSSPIFYLEGEPGVELVAKVVLPDTLPPSLRQAESKFTWRTERRAKQDAAFQAYLALYHAGVVTEYLLPPEWPKKEDPDGSIEKRDREYDVQNQHDPWPTLMKQWATTGRVYTHRLQVEAVDCDYPAMLLLLPQQLPSLSFPLFTAPSSRIQVSVSAGQEAHDFPTDLGRDISYLFLETILGRRLRGLDKQQLPFLLVPDLDLPSIRDWYRRASRTTALTDFLETRSDFHKQYLVQRKREVPCVWQPVTRRDRVGRYEPQLETVDGITTIVGTKLPRKLDYLIPTRDDPVTCSAARKLLPVDECAILGLSVEYGRLMLFIPSITHMLEVALRTVEACKGPLVSLGFDSIDLLSEAITTPAAGSRNYQRLEFLGDALLKFYSSLQVFVDHPIHPESYLTLYRTRIINNARLQRTTRALGLDQYITRKPFAGKQWSIGVSDPQVQAQKLPESRVSSKTLADVVEAVIGAASLSGVEPEDKDAKVLSALRLFIEEISWKPLLGNIAQFELPKTSLSHEAGALQTVESLIGYSFGCHALLAQALTQSSLGGDALSSYDRLEFLGDAILDQIVDAKLFHSSLQLDPREMTLRHHALVNHATLAFFALQTSTARRTFDVQMDVGTEQFVSMEKTETVYLPDHIRRTGTPTAPLQRRATLAAYEDVRSSILESFANGKTFPWSELLHVGAPKHYSDIVESILAAVFLDSQGDLTACEAVLEKMGYMALVRRLATDKDIDVYHPEELFSQLTGKYDLVAQQRTIKTQTNEDSGRRSWRCKVMCEGERIAFFKGATSKEEAQCRAAEKALDVARRKGWKEPVKPQSDRDGENHAAGHHDTEDDEGDEHV
ncbi:hypothetical protein AYO21_08235 [Fonsecaea monophora]|uniref:Dicer-like protein 2 n=1 Tax=Fonsecaea monophora TaxID=254056 RepID=A0A177EZL9_9EURO|nr:hypothetical protein AYO21_08235 [Fonsecaea monophora]OAG37503.1 hypothetical protein AYO21_08235 [Fonsecaea monophora]